jgi:tetratricopeptide (TPR) repeat protein
VELLNRLQRRLQDVAGRTPMREVTLAEKVAELRAALQRDARDLEAQKRLAWLAAEYFRKAHGFFNEGDFASAQNALDTGRGLFPEYRGAYQPLAERLEERGRLERLLAKAQEQAAAGRLVSPWRNNALHYYRSALRVDAELVVAQRGIREVERALMAQARSYYSAGDWDLAAEAAREVLDINPESQEAQSFLLTLEHRQRGAPVTSASEPLNHSVSLSEGVPVDVAATEGPRIQQLRVDGKLLSGMNARQLQAIQAQRTLFVSFEYKDFPPGQSQLAATLLDAQGKRLAEVPVVLSEANGLQRFRIERSQVFPPGEYQLSLSLDDGVLIRAGFLIQ